MVSVLLKPEKQGVKEELLFLSKDDVKEALIKVGLKIDNNAIYTKEGNVIRCDSCGDILTIDSVGTFFPGSVKAICKKFICFVNEMTKTEKRLRKEPL